jgi:hypothetical protein
MVGCGPDKQAVYLQEQEILSHLNESLVIAHQELVSATAEKNGVKEFSSKLAIKRLQEQVEAQKHRVHVAEINLPK